jgi:hypothetical protein
LLFVVVFSELSSFISLCLISRARARTLREFSCNVFSKSLHF